MSSKPKTTVDHETIRNWVEDRNGRPAKRKGSRPTDKLHRICIDFPQFQEQEVEDISWNEFFEQFDKHGLVFLYQDASESGEVSRFCKFMKR